MAERTFETGGEILKVGDLVVVVDQNGSAERRVVKIGTQRLHVENGPRRSTEYSLETRRILGSKYSGSFRTLTENAALRRRSALLGRLKELGLEGRQYGNGLKSYSSETLERIIGLLESDTDGPGL